MASFYELHKNKEHIRGYKRNGNLVVEVDTSKVTFGGKPWKLLSDFYKRKFENLIVLEHPMEKVKMLYG